MKIVSLRTLSSLLCITGFVGLSACSTVDLTQVAVSNQIPQQIEKPQKNVVERASKKLTDTFAANHWSRAQAKFKPQTAASVLLNGLKKETRSNVNTYSGTTLERDLEQAKSLVIQTKTAAEIYLAMAEVSADISNELACLESALLSARQAQSNFQNYVKTKSRLKHTPALQAYEGAVSDLQSVTDVFGERTRTAISSHVSAKAGS